MVIQEQKTKHQNKIIQKRVIGRQDDRNLPHRHGEKTNNSPASRQEKHPHQNQLQRERAECRRRVKPMWKVLDVPPKPRRQRTILVILIHRREVSPFGIATCNLCDPRFKVNPEPFPEQKEHTGANGRMPAAESRTPSLWSEEQRNNS